MLNFSLDNQFSQQFTADPIEVNYPRQVNSLFSYVEPQKPTKPFLIAYSDDVANVLGLSKEQVLSEDFLQLFSGENLSEGMQPYAMCYGGHQFGQWAGQLGDGRAINLAEIKTPLSGHKTLQLKGAGRTPYSRSADGLAVLRSSIREFLCSEAMYHLGIATTRALSLSLTGDKVMRDMFYDGNAKLELGAVVCRVSSSFIRFGSFQLPASRKDNTTVKALLDYVIKRDFSYLGEPTKEVYIQWFNEVCQRTCAMIIDWMRVGFVHGVMNTDNMSIIGETIDYGPYGWIESFDLNWTPNTTDAQGKRYRFGAQAEIAQWNLFQLANAIYPLFDEAKPLQDALNNFANQYQLGWHNMMADKLGIVLTDTNNEAVLSLAIDLEKLLTKLNADMTLFYRKLSDLPTQKNDWISYLAQACYDDIKSCDIQSAALIAWLENYTQLRNAQSISASDIRASMNKVNPKYVLRNYLAQQAIELAEKGDFSMIVQLQEVLKKPYEDQLEFDHFAQKRPDWAKNKAGCSMLSCSS